MRSPESHNLLAYVDREPVGMASGVPGDEESVAELISMWVAPTARGRGVGDALIRAVESWARAGRARELRLSVACGNEAAAALYRRHGYVDTGLRVPMPDGIRQEVVMSKRLPAET